MLGASASLCNTHFPRNAMQWLTRCASAVASVAHFAGSMRTPIATTPPPAPLHSRCSTCLYGPAIEATNSRQRAHSLPLTWARPTSRFRPAQRRFRSPMGGRSCSRRAQIEPVLAKRKEAAFFASHLGRCHVAMLPCCPAGHAGDTLILLSGACPCPAHGPSVGQNFAAQALPVQALPLQALPCLDCATAKECSPAEPPPPNPPRGHKGSQGPATS